MERVSCTLEAMGVTLIDPSFWRGRRVLITGHTGFKGSWLALWLLELGAEVYGLSLPPIPVPAPGQALFDALDLAYRLGDRHYTADIRDFQTVSFVVQSVQPEVVFHLGAQPLVRQSYEDPLGTWSTNVQGSLIMLEALRLLRHPCSVVMITTDKVYQNLELCCGYTEEDQLGGHDPYSASKAAMELMVSSWRASFCGESAHQTPYLTVSTARAGNVIGGGDWASDRIVPDTVRALMALDPINVRNPAATRPWQHVLEPLAGYLQLAQRLVADPSRFARPYNFGPSAEANRTVRELVEEFLCHWPHSGCWHNSSQSGEPHEAVLLQLNSQRAQQELGWYPRWSFSTTVARTAGWYFKVSQGVSTLACCLDDLTSFPA
jgi:CDP-glucose 4,6-dehydratase